MTVDAVAKAAGVTRSTIYLAVAQQGTAGDRGDLRSRAPGPSVVRTGGTREDLKTILRQVEVSFVDHQNTELLGPLQSERTDQVIETLWRGWARRTDAATRDRRP